MLVTMCVHVCVFVCYGMVIRVESKGVVWTEERLKTQNKSRSTIQIGICLTRSKLPFLHHSIYFFVSQCLPNSLELVKTSHSVFVSSSHNHHDSGKHLLNSYCEQDKVPEAFFDNSR